jgi:hypothetical protein
VFYHNKNEKTKPIGTLSNFIHGPYLSLPVLGHSPLLPSFSVPEVTAVIVQRGNTSVRK